MVRPGLRRLQEAQRVKVQLNLAGTSTNQNQSVIYRRHTGIINQRGVLFSETGMTQGSTKIEKKVTPTFTATEKFEERCCENNKNKVWGKDSSGKIIGATYPPTNVTY